ncbi:MAG: pyrroline-5-carboxylate reductase [Oscillospiraceae bacterium]|nr:MAG: pyrroline-5-carboxylate reductase [Oscillospiraceae bacterium]
MYQLGVIGLGHIGVPIVEGAVHRKLLPAQDIILCGHHPEKMQRLIEAGAAQTTDEAVLAASCRYLLLAVKPQSLPDLLPKIRPSIRNDQVIISIAAGISADFLKAALGKDTKIVLAMPNTPIQLGYGATAVARIEPTTPEEFDFALKLFAVSGSAQEIPAGLMNEVIPLNGSSPAFLYRIAQVFVDRGVEYGFDRQAALSLFCSAMIGAAHMMLDSGSDLDTLIQGVCSKGGTTIAGLTAMEEAGLTKALSTGITACVNRAYELGK